jgi:NTE family protein
VSDRFLERLNEAGTAAERDTILVEYSLRHLSDESRRLLEAAAIPHEFDAPFLSALTDAPLARAQAACAELAETSHVRRRRGRYQVAAATRAAMLDRLWGTDRRRFLDLSRRATEHCLQQDRADRFWLGEYAYHAALDSSVGVLARVQSDLRGWNRDPTFIQQVAALVPKMVGEQVEAGRAPGPAPTPAQVWSAMTQSHAAGFEVALALEGGGALCAYQGGVYEALDEAKIHPVWVTGESMGAVNAAIIAGNPPERRVAALRDFLERASTTRRSLQRPLASQMTTQMSGVRGVFRSRLFPSFDPDKPSGFYDTTPLRETLLRLVDFERLNDRSVRLSVGATNATTGNFVVFDTFRDQVGPEHIMASGAAPPAFPAIRIDGESYWDGGLVSQTPLQNVLNLNDADLDLAVFQVHLFSTSAKPPESYAEVLDQADNIRYASRSRLVTDYYVKQQRTRETLRSALERIPKRNPGEEALLADLRRQPRVSIVNLVYRREMDAARLSRNDFSRTAIETHWRRGVEETRQALAAGLGAPDKLGERGIALTDPNRQN